MVHNKEKIESFSKKVNKSFNMDGGVPSWHPHQTYEMDRYGIRAYCSNYSEHTENDYNKGNAVDYLSANWEEEGLAILIRNGWIIPKKESICICPTCALKNGLIEQEKTLKYFTRKIQR